MKKVAFYTLGCKVNQYETELMEGLFEEANYSVVDAGEFAHVYLINTCTVTNLSDRKSRQFIRRAKALNEDAVVTVVGCYSQISPEEIEELEEVDVIIGTSERYRVVELSELAMQEREKINIVRSTKTYDDFEEMPLDDIKSMTRAYIKVQDGCNQFCSYCIIPYARGPIRSRDAQEVYDEVERLTEAGFKEVILTGIHLASYGKDSGGISLSDLILKISEIPKLERIRLSSLEPNIVTDEFMQALIESGKVCHHFHLSLQSGSDRILKKMNRKYSRQEYKEKIELIRSYMPDAGITTDVIIGFPGETDEDFADTMEFVEDLAFSRVHVFKYSPREGTVAARMKEQIAGNIKTERSRALIDLADRLREDFNKKYLGQNMEVLYELENQQGLYEGYSCNYIRVKSKGTDDIIGNIVETELKGLEGEFMLGQI